MPAQIDITNRRFNRLVVIAPAGGKPGLRKWLCQCDCGNTKVVFGGNLRAGYTQSCGCLHKERTSTATRTHGAAGIGASAHTAEYNCWRSMKSRCAGNDLRYGGRGITVCAEWLNSYPAFLTNMGPKPTPKHTIERIDNSGPYAPWNCRWATMSEQAINKRNNRWITYRGQRRIMSHVAAEHGFDVGHFRKTLMRCDWDGDKAAAHLMSL